MIELIDVYKSFNNKRVLNGVSFTVKKGETFVIIGRSGTGKTVTLRHIAGLIEPDSGEVLIDEVRMDHAPRRVKDIIRQKMGVLFQSGALINWMTVRDNVALPLEEFKLLPEDEIEEVVSDRLRILQIADAGDKFPSEISGGMNKRAGLARALVRNPEIILYDEPTSGLDPVMSSMINKLIRDTQQEYGVTSVVVSHDMRSAYEIGDRIAMLHNGTIVQCDSPDGIRYSTNPIVKQFIEGNLMGPIDVE
jgi:phospholipid/cholesterol/gamma-HCH transport system ATP-binding protein